MRLGARWVHPVSTPPIEDGMIVVEGDRIVSVGSRQGTPDIDLGDAALLPGLVNAHAHIEHSALKGRTTPGSPFTEWVKELTRESSQLTRGDVRIGIKWGQQELLKGGTTTVADHASPDSETVETPLRRVVFWEVLGAHEGRARAAHEMAARREQEEGGHTSPHSLYAVHEETLEAVLHGREHHPLSIHCLESADEDAFFRTQKGPLAVYVQERGGDLAFPFSSPVQWLAANHGLDGRLLLVHANYLNPTEIGALRGTGAFVIHCPGSHRFFGHRPFPLQALRKAGVPVALGTDSWASNDGLSMLREMRLLKENAPDLSAEDILKIATLEGARALGWDKDIGSLEAGKKADLIAVKGGPLASDGVVFAMIDGKVVLNHV